MQKDKIKEKETPADPCNQIVKMGDIEFTYDDKGRLTIADGQDPNYTTYVYNNKDITIKDINVFGEERTVIYYLDANNRIKGSSRYDEYHYNNEGYLTSYKSPIWIDGEYSSYILLNMVYQNGNMVKVKVDGNTMYPETDFTYTEHPYQNAMGYNSTLYLGGGFGERITFWLINGGFFGKQSKNLLKTIDRHNGYITNFSYTFDTKGRLTHGLRLPITYRCN